MSMACDHRDSKKTPSGYCVECMARYLANRSDGVSEEEPGAMTWSAREIAGAVMPVLREFVDLETLNRVRGVAGLEPVFNPDNVKDANAAIRQLERQFLGILERAREPKE